MRTCCKQASPNEYAEHTGEHDWAYWMQHLEETLRFFGKTLTAGIPAP